MNAIHNARFWIRWNRDWVKLTLTPDQTLKLHGGGPTDEGWSYTRRAYLHAGTAVTLAITDRGRDCDGVSEDHRELTCPLADLKANADTDDADQERPPLPAWNLESQQCRDQFAEAAGY